MTRPDPMRTQVIKIDPREPEARKIEKAAKVLKAGGLVAFPTETVYGLGADSSNKKAIGRLYKVKKRPKDKPFTIQIADPTKVEELTASVPQGAYKLMWKFWPGPLTLILNAKSHGTVGLRCPRGPIVYSLIRNSELLLAVPSANLSGNSPAKTAKDVIRDLDGQIEMVLDGGRVELGVESTVVDFTAPEYRILRKGALSEKEIEKAVAAKFILFVCTGNTCRSVMASGLLRERLKGKEEFEIVSAGIFAVGGSSPSEPIIMLMKEAGIDVSGHRTQRLTDNLVKMADIIFVMDNTHKQHILERVPDAKEKMYLLKEYGLEGEKEGLPEPEIPDPIGRPLHFNRYVFNIIKESIERIAPLL